MASGPIASAATASQTAPVPAITAGSSPKPTDEEWTASVEASNQADAKWWPAHCSLRQVREWIRVGCDRSLTLPVWTSPTGKLGVDYFTVLQLGKQELIVCAAPVERS